MTARVVVTGLGLITPYGMGTDPFWRGLLSRESAIRESTRFDATEMPSRWFGELPAIDYDEWLDPRASALWSDASKLAVLGATLALRDAALEVVPAERTGVILGTGYGCMHDFGELFRPYAEHGWRRIKPSTIPKLMPNAPASQVAIQIGAKGPNLTVTTACSSGAVAIQLALDQLRAGRADVMVTGGFDVIVNEIAAGAWNNLRVLSRRNDATACRPFAKDRDGLVLGEGCAMLVLEREEHARARSARIRCRIDGGALSNDAGDIVHPTIEGPARAMSHALQDAGFSLDRIDWINAHGTGTIANDRAETMAIKEVFGARASQIPVSSIKGHLGHAMGAAGAIEAASVVLALEHQLIPPTLHHVPGDPDCDLDYVPDGPRAARIEGAMSNSFGFGGQNAVLCFSVIDR